MTKVHPIGKWQYTIITVYFIFIASQNRQQEREGKDERGLSLHRSIPQLITTMYSNSIHTIEAYCMSDVPCACILVSTSKPAVNSITTLAAITVTEHTHCGCLVRQISHYCGAAPPSPPLSRAAGEKSRDTLGNREKSR